jgi:beta-lactamase regulating signal transducer with metallopeptidase domain
MSHLIASLAWCWLQVLLVAAAAIGLSLLILRRSPTAGATIAWSGVIAALTLTGLAIVPFPARAMQRKLGELAASQSRAKRTAISTPKLGLQTESDASGEAGFQAALNGPLFGKLLESLRTSESAVVRNRGAVRWALGVAAIGSAIGLLRLMNGLMAIAALRRRSTVVPDCGVSELLADLLPGLSLRHLPQLRETGDLDSAAVVGWWRPAIVLPGDWREWSLAELKAVLAHELAHIARHDALWRLVATFTVALHWGQPLMHWLRRQLLLAQELAADELAAAAMGSKQEYLQALAKLALRQDSRPAAAPPAALLPVFSGFLLRRMVMLRAKDGSLHRDWRLLMQGSAMGLVAAITLLATAIRGLAEPPATTATRRGGQ